MFFGSTGAHAIQTFEQSQLSLAPKISIVLLHILSTFNYILTKLTVDFTKGGFGTGGGFYPPEPIIQSNSNPNPISTENPCVTNSTYYFQCTNRRHECIPRSLICDGEFDCTDGSDEFTCRQRRGTNA